MSAARTGQPTRGLGGVLLGVTLLAACAAAGFALYHLVTPRPATLYPAPLPSLSAPREAQDTPAAMLPGAQDAPAQHRIPEAVPALTLPGPDGVIHSLADYRGKVLLINFWATWCEPCRREIPLLQTLRRERAKDGVEIVGIAIDNRDSVVKYAAERQITYPLMVAEQGGIEAVRAFGMDTVLPFSVFADPEGRLITLKIGELHADEAQLILDHIAALDEGRLSLSAAREQIAAGISRLNAARSGPTLPAKH